MGTTSVTRLPSANSQPLAFVEIGTAGLKRFGGTIYEEFLLSLRGQDGVRVYREMYDNDPIVGGSLSAYEHTIRNSSWLVKPGGDSNLALRAAKHVLSCMNDMSHSWTDFITEALTFLQYGWAWHEVVYKIRGGDSSDPRRRSKFDDGLIGWRKLPLRLQSSLLEWEFDESDGAVKAMVQQAPPDYTVRRIPIEKSLLFRTKKVGNNPEGYSLLRHAYRPWFFKKGIEEIEAIGIERDLIGLAVIQGPEGFDIDAPENSEVKDAIKKTISSLRRDERDGLYLPAGWSIELLSGGGDSRRQFDIDKIINRYDKRISLSLLTQAILLGMDRVGSFALSENQTDDFFLASAQGFLSAIAEPFNNIEIPRLMRLNPEFAPLLATGEVPELVPGRVTEPNLRDLGDYIKNLSESNVLVPDEEMIEDLIRLGNLSEPTERKLKLFRRDEEDRRKRIRERLEQQMELQAQLVQDSQGRDQGQQGPQRQQAPSDGSGDGSGDGLGTGE